MIHISKAIFIANVFIGALAAAGPPTQTVELYSNNTLVFENEITRTSVDTLAAAILGKRAALPVEQTLYVVIFSPGGDFARSQVLKTFIDLMPNVALICRSCYSGAAYIFCTSKQPKFFTADSSVMFHEAFKDHVTARDVREGVELLSLVEASDKHDVEVAAALGMPLEAYHKKVHGTEWVLSGAEINKAGCRSKITKIKCDPYIASILPNTCK